MRLIWFVCGAAIGAGVVGLECSHANALRHAADWSAVSELAHVNVRFLRRHGIKLDQYRQETKELREGAIGKVPIVQQYFYKIDRAE
jgi:hypothetical protein